MVTALYIPYPTKDTYTVVHDHETCHKDVKAWTFRITD